MGELDKLREEFADKLRFMKAQHDKTGEYTTPELFGSTMALWTLAKKARNKVQYRPGELRRARHNQKTMIANIQDKRRFMEAAKRLLSPEQYLAIWEAANAHGERQDQPSGDSPQTNS